MNEQKIEENLGYLKDYTENQGDKFHPLSDQLLGGFDEESTTLDTLAKITKILDDYEANPESVYHLYHVGKLRAILENEDVF